MSRSDFALETTLTNFETREGLAHPNLKLFTLLEAAENYSPKHAFDGADVVAVNLRYYAIIRVPLFLINP